MTSDDTSPDDADQGQVGEVLTELADHVRHLTIAVATLQKAQSNQKKGRGEAEDEPPPRPWCWLRMSHAEKADRLAELADWVRDVLFAWPDAQRALTPCWSRHWDVIEDLSMLLCAWKTAYLWEGASSREAGDYLDRLLPAAIARALVRLRPCTQTHHPDGSRRDDAGFVDRTLDELHRL